MNIIDMHILLEWITQHAYYAGVAVFLVALAESLVLVGLFIPGTVIMFGIGALVSTGAMELWVTLIWATAGAIAGDAISYWLGHHYREQLRFLWPFSRHPQLLARGEAYFRRHGDKSVFLGRFIGPIRPIIPAVAGMLGMSPRRFYFVNILSALGWAPAHIVPGMLFGASLELAGTVATRLTVFITLFLLAIWFWVWGIRHTILWLQPRFEASLIYIQTWADEPSEGHPIRNLINVLLNPEKPEFRTLLVLAGLLAFAAWGFFGILEDIITADPLVLIDSSTYHILQGLRTPFGDNIMVALTELGDVTVTLTVVISVLLWLLWKHAWRAAVYWVAAAGFATILTQAIKAGLGRARPFPLYEGASLFSFPSGHATMSMVTYGFLAVLISRELSPRGRLATFTAIMLLVVLIAFSRLYLGVHWLSDVLGGVTFGLAWIAVLGIAYSRHSATELSPRGLMTVAFLALLLSGTSHVTMQHTTDIQRYAIRQDTRIIAQQDWWGSAWQTLPAWRIDIEGEHEQPLTMQWVGSLASLRQKLITNGWQYPPNEKNWLLWLDTTRPAMQLPLLPLVHDGHYDALALIYPVVNHNDQRLVLHLWNTGVVLRESSQPVWVGSVALETLRHPLSWFNLTQNEKDFDRPRMVLLNSLTGAKLRLVKRINVLNPENERVVWDGQVILAQERDQP
ncbi:MAG: VTT domain-containing protein [Sulfuriferula sp.]